ncbi:protein translocase subunit SecD [Cellulomonas sp. KRMCY2]|uniref:protein translocase subunit SecD n=1 Tax=Cellulomonas sp. KRMCY2 TaxID=1304865 RepID=UPI0004A2A624|nr:protein translocase subunit SecD [Cellulomonas sp. KRMCY2]
MLGILVTALFGGLLAGTTWSDASLTPKLALDLEGGTQVILRPTAQDGSRVTDDTISQAIDVIRQRIDASGVAEAEITSQGGSNIVVALPGEPDEATLRLVRESAQMLFRPVIVQAAPEASEPAAAPTATPATDVVEPVDASDPAWLTDALLADFQARDCTDPANLSGGSALVGDQNAAVVACDASGTTKYVLGPVEVQGSDIDSASSGLRVGPSGIQTNEWVTNISFNGDGAAAFRTVTTRLLELEPPRNQFAMVLDGLVISAPSVNAAITNGMAEISGTFTRETAATLARQLNFGALPLTFEVQSEQQISATLGSEQLQRGLLAGLVGLILVGIYSIVQYRALGAVTIASLAVAGVLVYAAIALLSWTQGYRLSLPGVAGIIVAIGITADSFIVYFERIRDELRDGRTLVAAVDEGWLRARRTILASDAVNFLAAFVLYFLAVGGVRGFAFTLGLTTLIDLMVVFLFTHPVMLLLARTSFFGQGHKFSGLDPGMLGARSRYVGRGRVAPAAQRADRTHPEGSERELDLAGAAGRPTSEDVETGDRRLTIAERRAAARKAAQDAATVSPVTTAATAEADAQTDRKDA